MSTNRLDWIDASKTILIVLVVIGHSRLESSNPFIVNLIYGFHMPVFFILSGFLLRPCNDWNSIKTLFINRTKRYFVPYCVFFILISLLNNVSITPGLTFNAVFSGKRLMGIYGTFWYIPTLLLAEIFFQILMRTEKNTRLFTIAGLYILSIIYSQMIYKIGMLDYPLQLPWNFDVALMALVYIFIGYYIKMKWGGVLCGNQSSKKPCKFVITILSILLAFLFGLAQWKNIIPYKMDMKNSFYIYPILSIVIPIMYFLIIYSFSSLLCKFIYISKICGIIGTSTMTIMYLHLSVKALFESIFGSNYSVWGFVLTSIVLSIFVDILARKTKITSFLITGKIDKSSL